MQEGKTVANIDEFRDKWGAEGPTLIVGNFIELAPEFPGDRERAQIIGEMMGDLQFALKHLEG